MHALNWRTSFLISRLMKLSDQLRSDGRDHDLPNMPWRRHTARHRHGVATDAQGLPVLPGRRALSHNHYVNNVNSDKMRSPL